MRSNAQSRTARVCIYVIYSLITNVFLREQQFTTSIFLHIPYTKYNCSTSSMSNTVLQIYCISHQAIFDLLLSILVVNKFFLLYLFALCTKITFIQLCRLNLLAVSTYDYVTHIYKYVFR